MKRGAFTLLTNLFSSHSRDGGVLPAIPPSEDSSVIQHDNNFTKCSQNLHVNSNKEVSFVEVDNNYKGNI
ncbi:hypothetical protein E2C01_095492 [Portunus trituberculatus]|uniref:Uncharacterized protein n=1 Tax=Portunus trituberculatus TaxID=210409 RepID=A0A5B7K0A3_PORTR|nr:hypothetical protein [Portunus trituberculatus]